jgi:hypothetical protein
MAHPKGGYRDADGQRIPGVTTVIGRFKESGGLIRWAYNRGREGEDLYDSRDKAAEAGTAACRQQRRSARFPWRCQRGCR